MPAVPVWIEPFTLTSPGGDLEFNVQAPGGGIYKVDQSGCKFRIGVRSTKSHVPQADGDILHQRFLTGVELDMAVGLWADDENPACDELLVAMLDDLTRSLRAILNAVDNEGRIAWEIPGGNTRMLDNARLLGYPDPELTNALTVVKFTIDTEFPYAQDLTPVTTTVTDGGSQVFANTGSAAYWPVFLVNKPGGTPGGSVSAFEITNVTTGKQIVYDSGLPGAVPIPGGSWAEINTFRNTIFQDGDGADLLAGVDELNSDFFALEVGSQTITIDGCGMDVLWAPAWG